MMEDHNENMPGSLLSAVEVLVDNMMAYEPFILYKKAHNRLNEDQEAMKSLQQISELQTKIRSDQLEGKFQQQDVENLRNVQNEIQQNQSIVAYIHAQQTAVKCLREINQEISQLLGVDFASLARQSSC
jgi:cell fate (sporulation/competence/biofilm development) regulator YlbF (YheA/YmcA/DUF963 family)